MQFTSGDATFHYVDHGDPSALPVVFIHGFPFSHAMWEPQLKAVAKKHRAIAYDLRGHGESSVGDGQYTIEQHVDDVFALLDHLGITKVVVVGLSMGGYVALRALERDPAQFAAAVLCDTRSEADDNAGKLKRAAGVAAVKRDGAAAFAESFIPAVFSDESRRDLPDVVEGVRATIEATPPLSLAGSLLAMAGRTDTTASLVKIKIPTLILVGEHDKVTPPAASESMREKIKGAELHVVPGAGHLSNLENSKFFNARLLEFLRGL